MVTQQYRDAADVASDEDLEIAFRALATFACSKCGRALEERKPTDPERYWRPAPSTERGDRHICCGTAHCPYCGRPARERCRHLVALREHGHWRLPGFARGRVAGESFGSAPAHGLPDGQIPDYEDRQKRAAFRTAYPLLTLIYEEGFTRRSDEPVLLAPLLGPSILRGDRCMEVNVDRRYHRYQFSPDPDAARANARAMIRHLTAGVERIKRVTPSALRFLHRELDVSAPTTVEATSRYHRRDGISALQFSPDGRLLLVGLPGEGQLWDVETGELCHRLPVRSERDGGSMDVTATFSPDGSHLSLAASDEWSGYGYSSRGHKSVGRTAVFHVGTGSMVAEVPSVTLSTYGGGYPADALLHRGAVVARVRGRFVHLTPLGERGRAVLGVAGAVRLPHRTAVRACAFSPDGRTFATVASVCPANDVPARRVLLWRVG